MAKKSQAVPPGQYKPGQRFANPNTNSPATTNAPPQGNPGGTNRAPSSNVTPKQTPTHLPGSGAKKSMPHGHM